MSKEMPNLKSAPPLICPDCGSRMIRRNSMYGLFYGCSQFPECRASHGCHQITGMPLGIPANKETKEVRIAAHEAFDILWNGGASKMSRKEAYMWLADKLQLPNDECHIGRFDKEMCGRVIAVCLQKALMG